MRRNRSVHPRTLRLIGIGVLLFQCLLIPGSKVVHGGAIVAEDAGAPFTDDTVMQLARELAREPFRQPAKAPEILTQLPESTYRQIAFQQNEAIWGRSPTRFSIQLFAPGYLYHHLVDMDVVENGWAYPVNVSDSTFQVPDAALGDTLAAVGKYAGIRLHYPINRDDSKDEFIVFQGASYFRAISKGQLYGLWARGLAIGIAQPKGEEHPLFRRFWIERPSADQDAIVVHALLDSESVAGAYRFGIYPGAPTRIDVEVVLFPRSDIPHVGLAPLNSMFLHGTLDWPRQPGYRPAVHDSEGLAMVRGNGERLWRPLHNPRQLQISAFLDENPKGFGLIQRPRQFDHYQDLDTAYERHPSAWVEPLGDWGRGQVELVEIPSDAEVNDNIVAYWRPTEGLKAGQPHAYAYRLTWPNEEPYAANRARIVRSAGRRKQADGAREVAIDINRIAESGLDGISVEAGISRGRILETRLKPHPHIGGARVFVRFDPEGADSAELRLQLRRNSQPVGSTWLYRFIEEDWP